MKRDMDLIRKMMLEVENRPNLEAGQIELSGYSQEAGYYNAQLAQEAGLIEATFLPRSTNFNVLRLTNAGHEFLEAARNDTMWAKAKETVIKNTGSLTLEALKIALSTLVNHLMLMGHTSVK